MIMLGTKPLKACNVGTTPVKSIYKGGTMIWSSEGIEDNVTLTVNFYGGNMGVIFYVNDTDISPYNQRSYTFTFKRGTNVSIALDHDSADGLDKFGWTYSISKNNFAIQHNTTVDIYLSCTLAIYHSYAEGIVRPDAYFAVFDNSYCSYTGFYGDEEFEYIDKEGWFFFHIPYGTEIIIEQIFNDGYTGHEFVSDHDLNFTITENVGISITTYYVPEFIEFYVKFDASNFGDSRNVKVVASASDVFYGDSSTYDTEVTIDPEVNEYWVSMGKIDINTDPYIESVTIDGKTCDILNEGINSTEFADETVYVCEIEGTVEI